MSKKITYILLGVIGLITFIGLLFYKNRPYQFVNIGISNYVTLLSSEEKKLVYVTSDTCEVSKTTTPIMKKVFKGSNIRVNNLNVSKLSNDEKGEFIRAHVITSESNSYSTPMLLFIESGNIKDSIIGIFTEEELIDFLTKNKIVE